jgi:hypothetical protein
MKICICSFSDRPCLYEISFPNIKQYCNKWGYNFFLSDKSICPDDYHPSWNTIYLAKGLLDANDYDYVVWIDDDILITDMEKPLTDFIVDGKLIIFQQDTQSKQFYGNCGFVIFKKESLPILETIIEKSQSSIYKSKHPWEQGEVNNYYKKCRELFYLHPMRTLQSYSQDCGVWANGGKWEQGDFSCHWAGVKRCRDKKMKLFTDTILNV